MSHPSNPDPLSRRAFLQSSSALAALAITPLGLNALAAAQPDRLRYDVSRYNVTDSKLIRYEEVSRLPKVAARPRRILALPGGQFLVAGEPGAILFSRDGKQLQVLATSSPARCAARDQIGKTYVGTREGIEVFDKDGQKGSFWPAPNKKTWFTGLAANDDHVYAADSGNRMVLRFDPAGSILGRIGEKSKERNVPGIILPSPYLNVAFGKDGLLRVNNTGRHRVELYTPDGDLELAWGKPTAAIEGFCGCCNPVSLAMLPDGRCVTAEKGLPRVKVYSPDGTFESVVAGVETFPENSRHGSARDPIDGTMGGLDVAVTEDGAVLVLDLVTGDVHVRKAKA